jgi:WS/DGAT/MGAT family acyltransferase
MVIDRLSADDQLMLWPDALWPQDVGALGILDGAHLLEEDGALRIEALRAAVERRLHLLPRFRQVLHEPGPGLGGPLWVDANAFDLREHMRVVTVPPPGDEAQLLAVVEHLRRRRLDRTRPLWEMWFLPGLARGRVGLFVRMHHVVADGVAGIAAIGALLDRDADPGGGAPEPWNPAARPTPRDLVVENLQRRAAGVRRALSRLSRPVQVGRAAADAWPFIRELVGEEPGPQTSLSRLIGSERRLAIVRTRLDLVTGIAHAHDATVNDVLLAVTAGGLRRLLSSRGESLDCLTVPIYVPVSLRHASSGGVGGNLISQMVVPLPLGIPDSHVRLRTITGETATRKAVARPPLGMLLSNRIIAGGMLRLIARQRVNIVSADLPGPPLPLAFAGAHLLEVFPLINLIGTVTLGVGALSYAGQFNVMAVADADTYPDLAEFTAGVEDELRLLTDSLRAQATAR